jgi:hypothetical protein
MKVFAFFGVLVLFAIVNTLIDHLTGWTEGGSQFAKIAHHIVVMTGGAVLWKIGEQFWNW